MSKKEKSDDRTLFAFLATFLSIIGFIVALAVKKEDKYVMFYAKQSLVVFIFGILLMIVNSIFLRIPFLGFFISMIVSIVMMALWVVSWIYALSGKEKEVPIIGVYAKKFDF